MLRESFESVVDPRQQGKVKHNLLEIIVMTICAVIAAVTYGKILWTFAG